MELYSLAVGAVFGAIGAALLDQMFHTGRRHQDGTSPKEFFTHACTILVLWLLLVVIRMVTAVTRA